MSDETKPIEAVGAPKLESEAAEVDSTETSSKPEASGIAAAPKEEVAAADVEKAEVKSEESVKVKKEEGTEKDSDSVAERKSRSQSPHSNRQRDDRSRSPRNDRRNNDRRGRGRDDRNGGDRKGFQHHNKKDGIKSVYALAESSDADEIRKQVEFYFSDSNLCQDRFLFTQTGGTENKPIPISVIHSFKRMRHFQPFSAVVAALKESKTLEVVNDNEVKRKTPLPIDKDVNFEDSAKLIEDAAMARSIYVKGFGDEGPTTQLDIEDFFAPFGPINMIKLRRDFNDKVFKGSVFVEFENEEVMQDFMDMESKPQWKGQDLKYMTKKAYCETKVNDINSGKIRRNEHDRSSFRGRGGGRGRGDRGRGRGRGGRGNNDRRDRDGGRRGDRDGDDRDWKTRRDNDQRKDRKGGDGRQRSASPKAAVDDRGIPVVHTSTEPTAKSANGTKKESSPVNEKKRSREDDDENTEAKKVKAEA